jgi:uncharacterized C2H2 Zn-finger protein
MKEFECNKCNKIFKFKHHLQRHLNKKNPCDKILFTTDNTKLVNTAQIIKKNNIMTTNNSEISDNNIATNNSEILDNNIATNNSEILDNNIAIPSSKKNECYYCYNIFSKKSNLERHIKNSCLVVKEKNKKLQDIYEELQNMRIKFENMETKFENMETKHDKEISELRSQLITNQKEGDSITYNHNGDNNVINNTINIVITGCGKEDMNKINPELEDIISMLSRGWQSPKYIINKTHFNPKFPEYHNLYIPDIKNKFVMINNGQNYLLKNITDVINDLYDRHIDYIKEKFNEYGDVIPKSKRNALNQLFKLYPIDEKEKNKEKDEMRKRLFEDIKLLLFNKRCIPIKTREKITKQNKEKMDLQNKEKMNLLKKIEIEF